MLFIALLLEVKQAVKVFCDRVLRRSSDFTACIPMRDTLLVQ